jgi:hypothetical protein
MRPLSRSIRSRSSIWALLVVFLMGTTMPGISRMECLMSGKSAVSVGLAQACCPEDETPSGTTVRAVCCEVLTAQQAKQPFTPQWPVAAPAMPAELRWHGPVVVALREGSFPRNADRPPPSARDRLASLCILVI